MCNKLHENYTPIPKEGKGYKLFVKDNKNLYSFITNIKYQKNNEGKIIWLSPIWTEENDSGFCFFLSLEEAERALRDWTELNFMTSTSDLVILPILYYDGLGKHLEDNFIDKNIYEVALCKAFIIMK